MTNELENRYRGALQDYLAHPDEALLERAYGLGRQALADGRGVLDMATTHSQALASVMASAESAGAPPGSRRWWADGHRVEGRV